jgi:hypothetical protein
VPSIAALRGEYSRAWRENCWAGVGSQFEAEAFLAKYGFRPVGVADWINAAGADAHPRIP